MRVEHHAQLQAFNTLALTASADIVVHADNDEDIREAIALAQRESLALVPLGGGSNVVLAGDVHAVVLRMATAGIEELARDERSVTLRVAAGENWHEFVAWCLDHQYFGLENLALIPGTVGAAPIQNIGAYGVELASFVEAVHGLDSATGEAKVFDREACRFGYRDSVFKHELRDRLVITSVDLRLRLEPEAQAAYPSLAGYLQERGLEATPVAVFDAVVAIRRQRLPDPERIPNVGSFFKNPIEGQPRGAYLRTRFPGLPAFSQEDGRIKLSAAWMIEHCGWKGATRDGVGVDDRHSLVLVNRGSNSGRDLLALAAEIRESVQNEFGYRLEIEPRVLGGSVD